ncbi:hypothetical protein GCM10010495_59200 [Kitasatospora herbaricolor]|nr:hypothetical protein GCM10010495_59200 [Kitasatospora herbaricolor]
MSVGGFSNRALPRALTLIDVHPHRRLQAVSKIFPRTGTTPGDGPGRHPNSRPQAVCRGADHAPRPGLRPAVHRGPICEGPGAAARVVGLDRAAAVGQSSPP